VLLVLDVGTPGFAFFARQQRFRERLGVEELFVVTAKPQRIDGEVAGDRQHPGPHLSAPCVVCGGASPDPQERLLRHLLGDCVGSPLVNALIFVAVAASFYAAIGQRVPGVDTGSREFRDTVAPLNRPSADVSPEVRAAAQTASTEAFHLAMLVAAGLMLAGAAVNGFGIRNSAPAGRHLGPGAEQPPPGSGSGTASGPVQLGAEEFRKPQPQADRTGPARPD
jgi:hypothetical protein